MREYVEMILRKGEARKLVLLPPGEFEMAVALLRAAHVGAQLQRERQERPAPKGKRRGSR